MLITLARKPLTGSVAANALQHGCGALNIDATRIGTIDTLSIGSNNRSNGTVNYGMANDKDAQGQHAAGRWPANILIDPTPAVLAHFPEVKGQVGMAKTVGGHRFMAGDLTTVQKFDHGTTDTGSAARFFKQILGD